MSEQESLREAKKVAIARWADRYTERFDLGLTNGWPDLAERLREPVAALSWRELGFGPGPDFQKRRVEPVVQQWVERHVRPIIDEATEEFRWTLQGDAGDIGGEAVAAGEGEGALSVQDVLEGLTLPAGVLVAGGAVVAAVAEVTVWLVFTTIVVNWPLLVIGLAVGGALSLFGVYRLARLRGTLQGRFEKRLLPAIQSAMIGGGVRRGDRQIPSLMDQLKRKVRETAEAARKALDAQG